MGGEGVGGEGVGGGGGTPGPPPPGSGSEGRQEAHPSPCQRNPSCSLEFVWAYLYDEYRWCSMSAVRLIPVEQER